MKKNLALILTVLFLLTGYFAACSAEPVRKKTTVMVYMCGSTLEMPPIYKEGSSAIEKIRSSEFDPEDVNIAVLLGGSRAWAGGYDSRALTLLTVGDSAGEEHLPLAPMNDPATLSDFLKNCYERFPAERYILIIWDHGGGPNLGVCQDALFPGSDPGDLESNFLSASDLAEAFRNSPFAENKLDLLVFSCCLMSSAELGAVLAPYVKYMAATEDQMYGLSYDWLSGIGEDPDILSTAKRMADTSFAYNQEVIQRQGAAETNTFSVVDLGKIDVLIEKTDEYFAYIADGMDDTGYTSISGNRRDTAAFGLSYTMENNFDLVDLADLALRNRDAAPEAADRLISAVQDAVVYSRSTSESCSGLTVYHPFLNKQRLKKWLPIHNSLGFSRAYSSYLNRFVSYLTGTPLAEWTGLVTGTPELDKAFRSLFTLALTEDQVHEYGESRLAVLRKYADDTYAFTYAGSGSLRDHEITGQFVRSALYAMTKNGELLTEELEYSEDENGFYHVPAVLGWTDGGTGEPEQIDAVIICSLDRTFQELVPREIMVREESMDMYRTVRDAKLEDFDRITLSTVTRRETRDAEGTLLPFRQWESAETVSRDLEPRGDWAFVLSGDSLPLDELYAVFEITDSQNNQYCSEPLSVKGSDPARESAAGSVLNYDDGNMILITQHNISERNGRLQLTLAVSNLLDREAVIGLENVILNGVSVDGANETWGNGPSGGQEPGEEQNLYISIPLAESAADMSFVLYSADPVTGEVLGRIPVTVSFH